jgi:hypothetical protein
MIARADESLGRVLDTIAHTNVLVVDDFATAPLHEQERRDFLKSATTATIAAPPS